MPTSRQEPSAPSTPSDAVWRWNGGETEEQERAREAAAARKRGLLGGVIGLAVAAVFYFLLKRPVAAAVVAAIALLFTLLALLAPTASKSVTRLLDRFAHAVGTAVTWVLLTIMYYLFFLPLGWFLRMRGKLAITRSFDPGLQSYWTSLEDRARTPESYRRQF